MWCLLIYGPRQNEFSQAIELAGFSAMCLLYFILVRRRFRCMPQPSIAKAHFKCQAVRFILLAVFLRNLSFLHASQLTFLTFWNRFVMDVTHQFCERSLCCRRACCCTGSFNYGPVSLPAQKSSKRIDAEQKAESCLPQCTVLSSMLSCSECTSASGVCCIASWSI